MDRQMPPSFGPDRKMVHISKVKNGLKCGCLCPAPNCNEPLIGKTNHATPHFSHVANSACGGGPETSIHLLSKEIVEDHKMLFLPEGLASFGEKQVKLWAAYTANFDRVTSESRDLERIVPDTFMWKRDRQLIVEMAVTHPCDPIKVARVRALQIPLLEIDLSSVPRNAERDFIVDAVLKSAPRSWLYHPRIDKKRDELRDVYERKEQQARLAFENKVDKFKREYERGLTYIAGSMPDQIDIPDELHRAGLHEHIGIRLGGAGCFFWPPSRLQLHIIEKFVVQLGVRGCSYRPKAILEDLKSAGALRPAFSFVGKKEEEALEALGIAFLSPYRNVEKYLLYLVEDGVIYKLQHGYQTTGGVLSSINDYRAEVALRKWQVEKISAVLAKIVEVLPETERNQFSVEQWLAFELPEYQASVGSLIDTADERFDQVELALRRIEEMLFHRGPIVESILGLPIAGEVIRQRELRERESAERLALKKGDEKRSREERLLELENLASGGLGEDASIWLRSAQSSAGLSPIDLARESHSGLQRATSMLGAELQIRERNLRKQNEIAGYVHQLTEEANRILGERAQYFLRSPFPKELGGKRPVEFCISKASLAQCLGLLKVVARGQKNRP